MLAPLPDLPADVPLSMWFLVAAAVVIFLQAIPYTGMFLMLMLGPLWAGVLINAAMLGITWEVLTGHVAAGWLVLPALYFGSYYTIYGWERYAARRFAREVAAFNAGKQLRFDPDRHDLVLVKGQGNVHLPPAALLETYALARVFDDGRMHFVGTAEACALVRDELSIGSGIGVTSWIREGGVENRSRDPSAGPDMGIISAPGQPDRSVLRVTGVSAMQRRALLHLHMTNFTLHDEIGGATCQLRAASVALLGAFPFPIIGFALDSGAPKWRGFAVLSRTRSQPLAAFGKTQDPASFCDFIARALALEASADLDSRAVDAETVAGLARANDTDRTEKELAILEAILADPLGHTRKSSSFHLVNWPAAVAPYADRIVAALGQLHECGSRMSETGRNLWRLAAVLPDAEFAPHRAKIVAWLDPATARPWTTQSGEIYTRLDPAIPQERAILLDRLETKRGDLETRLLTGFNRMGSAAPAEIKQRLLALWHARAPDPANPGNGRGREDAALYVTLARMGLKHAAGEVVQRYSGSTFAAIWSDVDADTHGELCETSVNALHRKLRRK